MLLNDFVDAHPNGMRQSWERDVGPLSGEQWKEVLQAVVISSMISQLYIILSAHFTSVKLHIMGMTAEPQCYR